MFHKIKHTTTLTILYKPHLMHFLTLARIHKISYHQNSLFLSFLVVVEKILDTSKVWIENTTWVGYILERGSRRRGYHVCSFTCLVSHKVVTTFWCCKSSYPISFSYSSFMLITKVSSHDTRIILSISFRYTYNYKSHASTH